MSNVKIKVNYKGIRALLKGDEVRDMIESIGGQIASRAGDGYGQRSHYTGSRSICNVYADSKEARRDNLENNTLLKATGPAKIKKKTKGGSK